MRIDGDLLAMQIVKALGAKDVDFNLAVTIQRINPRRRHLCQGQSSGLGKG
jgi:hypothetical protein